MSSSHRHQPIPTTSHGTHPRRPTTAPGSTSLRPELERRTPSNTEENCDPFEYLGCSNCTDDFSSHRASQTSYKPSSFWLMECGHLACAPCLGYPDVQELDPTQHYRCPIPSCRGFRSAVYELNRQKPIPPAIKEFFENPNSMTERLGSVLSFQNRQMKMRIANLNKLVHVQRQALRQHQANSNQEVPILKQQVYDLKHQLRALKHQLQQQHAPRPALQLPIHLDQFGQPSKPVKRRTTLDQNQGRQAQGIIPRASRASSFHHQHFDEPRNLPHDPRISRPHTATSFNSNPTVQVPRTISRGANQDLPLANMSHEDLGFDPDRRQRTENDAQERSFFAGDDRQVYNHQLGAIPEDEDQAAFVEDLRVAGGPSRRAPMKERMGGVGRSASGMRAEQPVRMPPDPRRAYGARVRPMPMPTPSRAAPVSGRRQETFAQPARPPNQAMNIPARRDSRVANNSPLEGFVYHHDHPRPKNAIVTRPDPRPPRPNPMPFPQRPPPELIERATPSKRPNPFLSRGPVRPRF
ncbi:hypothetical protein PTTG_04056 [Puccinia triticina 1-1 BBBD Race 1]|uniref:RING-type domain-containing protein n=2 Tax=Puccinia triticina TaxID=208348 RepID=A0A0C4ETC7_PUCT1|nr:uncharacterized protein PtA15_7A148 [Puccinia triticina]OAV87814.1 hypothetical protein PTTG_04056 [Puccinia triticina 1-1 BBBD Race 1]WAQ86422.1 hypothetical protein PtA15_7A148 [Puccinia triticina]WAR56304.1 hypothetical protein PtB15_7B150 [Puccinia triticina]